MSIKQGKCGFYHVDITIPGCERVRHSTGSTDRKEAQEYHDALKAKLLGLSSPPKYQRIAAYPIDLPKILAISIPVKRLVAVYFLIENGDVVYVGKTTDLFGRIAVHIREKRMRFSSFSFVEVEPDILDEVEVRYITGLSPKYNTANNTACTNRVRKHRAASVSDEELHKWCGNAMRRNDNGFECN